MKRPKLTLRQEKTMKKTFKTSLEKPFSFYEKVNVTGCKFWGSS